MYNNFKFKQDMFRLFHDHLQLWIRLKSLFDFTQAMAYELKRDTTQLFENIILR